MAQPRFTFQGREYDLLDFDEMTLRESFDLRRTAGPDASPKEYLAVLFWMSVRAVRDKTTWEWFLDHNTNADLQRMQDEIDASSEDDEAEDVGDGDADPPLRAVSGGGGDRGTSASTASSRGGSRSTRSKS